MLLKSEGGGEEGADLDDEAQETQDPRTETPPRRRRRRRKKPASPEPANRGSRAAWTQIHTGRTETNPAERNRRAGNGAHLDDSTSTGVECGEEEKSREREKGVNIGHGFRRGRERAEVSLFPREPARAARSRQNRQRERRKSMAEEKRKPRAYGQSQEREGILHAAGQAPNPGQVNQTPALHATGSASPFGPYQTRPN